MLDHFVQQHINAYIPMHAFSYRVAYQLTNSYSRVCHLINAIDNDDTVLQAAMANLEEDTGPTSKREDFERALVRLLSKDPVRKRGMLLHSAPQRRYQIIQYA